MIDDVLLQLKSVLCELHVVEGQCQLLFVFLLSCAGCERERFHVIDPVLIRLVSLHDILQVEKGYGVLVHCNAGRGRSVVIALAYRKSGAAVFMPQFFAHSICVSRQILFVQYFLQFQQLPPMCSAVQHSSFSIFNDQFHAACLWRIFDTHSSVYACDLLFVIVQYL